MYVCDPLLLSSFLFPVQKSHFIFMCIQMHKWWWFFLYIFAFHYKKNWMQMDSLRVRDGHFPSCLQLIVPVLFLCYFKNKSVYRRLKADKGKGVARNFYLSPCKVKQWPRKKIFKKKICMKSQHQKK
jgi:hypothetical protein